MELDLYQLYSTKFSFARQCGQTSLPELTARLTEEAADIRTMTQQMKAVRRFRCSIKTLDIACRISGSWRNSSAITMTSASARTTVVAAIVPTSSGTLHRSSPRLLNCNTALLRKKHLILWMNCQLPPAAGNEVYEHTEARTVCAGLHKMWGAA